jgi:WD40 repeat protein
MTQNTTVEIFKDDFSELTLDDTFIDRKLESQLREHAGLSNTEYSKKKKITSIHWQPKAKGVIAFGSVDGRSVDKRIGSDGRSLTSYVIVWNFNDPIWPQVVLESPYDIQCIEFNPTDPKILIGGLSNGQVALWDLAEAEIPEQPEVDMLGNEKTPSHIKSLRWKYVLNILCVLITDNYCIDN